MSQTVNRQCPHCDEEIEVEVSITGADRPASRECPPEYAEAEADSDTCPSPRCGKTLPDDFLKEVEAAALEQARDPGDPPEYEPLDPDGF